MSEIKKTIKDFKESIKAQATKIKETKKEIKRKFQAQEYAGNFQCSLRDLRFTFRHQHIAYCVLLGRKREEIEIPAENNLPNETLIQEILNGYKTQNVCSGS